MWQMYLNCHQRMEILPLKKRVSCDKCSFATKQCIIGVFAIDERGLADSRTFCHPGRSLHVFTNQHLKKWKPDDEPRLKSGKIHHLALRLRATHWVDLWPRAFCIPWIMSIVRCNLPLVRRILFNRYSAIFSSVIFGVQFCSGLLCASLWRIFLLNWKKIYSPK